MNLADRMKAHKVTRPVALAAILVATPLGQVAAESVASAGTPPSEYIPETPNVDSIATGASCTGSACAPWNTSQGDTSSPAYSTSLLLDPTYTPGGSTTTGGYPNLAVYPSASSGTNGVSPYPSGVVGTPGPLDDYCGSGSTTTEDAGTPSRQTPGSTLPFSPYYFPHVVQTPGSSSTQHLTGYFDYRPKDEDEALVVADSTNGGDSWTYQGEALEENPGYCASNDISDAGQGHANVISIGSNTYLYTLQRPAGDNVGVGMLVHSLDSATASDPLNGVPATEEIGMDPDDFASVPGAPLSVPFTGGTPVQINFTEPVGTGPEQLLPGEFVDLTTTPVPTASSVINCTTVGMQSISGCTTTDSSGITVNNNDLIEQVIGTISGNLAKSNPATACSSGSSTPVTTGSGSLPCTVPVGPNTTSGNGGLEGFDVDFASQVTASLLDANAPNRVYIDGVAVYCNGTDANPTNEIENCTTGPGGTSTLTVNSGDPVTSDPIVPATATAQTDGLVSPDGIVGVLPSYPLDPSTGTVPTGATFVMYTEKILNYYVAGVTINTADATFGSISSSGITFTPSPTEAQDMPATISSSSPVTVYVGDISNDSIESISCTGLTTGSTDTLTGCTTSAPSTDEYDKTSEIGAPNAAIVPNTTLSEIGEGAGASPSAKKVSELMKNNEDLTVLRVAWTTDGLNFSDAGLANGGVISGASNGASNYTDINNPSTTTSPSNLNEYGTAGTQDVTEMRFVGSAGTIIPNIDGQTGTDGLFLSGSWAADGDSDAFNQIFYATSTDGENWTIPTSVVSTDYTFSASAAQDGELAQSPPQDDPLGISAYYSGRAYGPSVIQNPDDTLTMVFAGYRTPKPIPLAGSVLGTNSSDLYTVGTDDPALYRNILTVTLTPMSNVGSGLPEAPSTLLIPFAGLLAGSGAIVYTSRRRRLRRSTG